MDMDDCYGGKVFETRLVRSRSFGSKRVALAANDNMVVNFYDSTPAKKLCPGQVSSFISQKSPIECLPQDILIQVLCGVEHDDLGNLILVSRAISEAALAAKQLHFVYSTPKKTIGFRDSVIAGDHQDLDDIGALAPKVSRRVRRSWLNKKKLSEISVQLFGPDTECLQVIC